MPEPQIAERLDYSQPPPGYAVCLEFGIGQLFWGCGPLNGEGHRGDVAATWEDALAAAWAHYKEQHDPPGMRVIGRGGELYQWDVRASGVYVAGPEFPVVDHAYHAVARTDARAAAWDWHDRRLALAEQMDVDGGTNFWPICLTWSDDDAAAVERWLSDSTAELPEVLRV